MYKKCFPSSASSDLPPTNMSKKRKAEDQLHPKVIQKKKKNPSVSICPKTMKQIYEQIDAHPNYKLLDSSTRFAYEVACKQGYSQRNNNKFVRDIWAKLHLNKPIQSNVVFDRKKLSVKKALEEEFEKVKERKRKLDPDSE
jgi:hypothetical protein